ncbi:prepilin peptidase [Oceanobacillus caeni]|uniref:prepilin peptidase n=1 Tax=Oceanobacillus TaxID=182709 RepID=UPI00214A0E69|nr:A24 family peptidase [Oceanobacillus caeni]MCR1834199.1 prepilin peptidase [Oceanobacillus caeni]
MDAMITIFFFVFGITFGSFFNVVGLRLPKNETFANDRSYCPSCKKQLQWYELIPVFSFLFQGGKCRNCKANISFIYPVVELFTGFLFAFSYFKIGLQTELITAILLVSMLNIILVSDITYMLIPNKVLLFFLPFFLIMRMVHPLDPWWSPIIGSIIGFGIIAIIILFSRGGMGAGDMKLFGVLGIILGTQKVLLAFFLACLIGAIIGMLFMIFKVIARKQPVPFGPSIILAALISYFYGDMLINWYLRFLL